jgi:hypothetical protein
LACRGGQDTSDLLEKEVVLENATLFYTDMGMSMNTTYKICPRENSNFAYR